MKEKRERKKDKSLACMRIIWKMTWKNNGKIKEDQSYIDPKRY